MKRSAYTLIYAAILGAICAALLTATAEFTRPYRDANREAEMMRNILRVFDIPFDPAAPLSDLRDLYENNIRSVQRNDITFFEFRPDMGDNIEAFGIEFSGSGLWAPIRGFLAVDPDLTAIRGLTIYEQNETPGLGGEIASPTFWQRFENRSLRDPQNRPGISIIPGGRDITHDNQVEGITGATMTVDKLAELVNAAIDQLIAATEGYNGR